MVFRQEDIKITDERLTKEEMCNYINIVCDTPYNNQIGVVAGFPTKEGIIPYTRLIPKTMQ